MTSPGRPRRDPIVAREVASDIIGGIIAWLSAKVDAERARPDPDQALVAYLEREDNRWVNTRLGLRKLDDEEIERAIVEYGAIARELRGGQG